MDKQFWLGVLKIIIKHFSSVKSLSKALAKTVVLNVLKFSGTQGYITTMILAKVIKWGIIELKDLNQKFKDHKLLKKFRDELPKGNTDERKKLEENILSGG